MDTKTNGARLSLITEINSKRLSRISGAAKKKT
jgi:hypothetical protein